MDLLGLSFDYHDSAAALVRDGQVIAAVQEERFSRKKNDAGLPLNAVRFCLDQAGISAASLGGIVFYENTPLKFDRILKTSMDGGAAGIEYFRRAADIWRQGGKLDVRSRIAKALAVRPGVIKSIKHHEAHAAAAFYCSPFQQATILTVDGVGEWETATVSIGSGNRIEKLVALEFPQSLGLFYSAYTAYLGFEVNEGEYKVMGMAAFGKPSYLDEVSRTIALSDDCFFRLDPRYFAFLDENQPYSPALVDLFGPSRRPESPFSVLTPASLPDEREDPLSRRFADIAASVQRKTEDVMLHMVERAVSRTGVREVCLAGGVALNSLANGRIQRELGVKLYVHPAAGDAGGALGAALHGYHHLHPDPVRIPLGRADLGPSYGPEEIKAALEASGCDSVRHFDDVGTQLDEVVKALVQGQVVGWFQGRTEWGPRALGCRSILANPMLEHMKSLVNEKVKFREPFRPFAPSVLAERALEYFEIDPHQSETSPEHFMLSVCKVRPEKRSLLSAVTHQDGTSRVQLVECGVNPLYHELIRRFGDATGVYALLNTSFNLRGEPIVNAPEDALRTFFWSGLDLLALGPFLVEKDLIQCE